MTMRREDTVISAPMSFDRVPDRFDTQETSVKAVEHVEQAAQAAAQAKQAVAARQPARPTPAHNAPPLRPLVIPAAKAPATIPVSAPMPSLTTAGKVLVVFGCRGGAGATTLAVNIAASLARTGKNVCVVDLDLQLGDVNVALDLEPQTSLAQLAQEAGNLDGTALRRRLQRHDSGVYCLSQVGHIDEVDPQLAERMPALFAVLAEHFDYVVVDGVRDFDDHSLAALDMADRIALVLTQDVPAVRRASRVTQLFRKLGYSDRKVQIVINRHSPKAAVPEAEIERVLGVPIIAHVRNDFEKINKALDEGALLHDVARGTGVARDVEALAARLTGEQLPSGQQAAVPAQRGFFARLFGGK
jgi:pilus assembly protein CpaE